MINKIISFFETGISSFAMLIMTLLTFVNVISRHFLKLSISFTEEITCGLFVLVCVMGTALCANQRQHLGMSITTDAMGPKAKFFFDGVGNLLSAIFCVILLVSGVEMVIQQISVGVKSIALSIPEAVYGSIIPIGAFFMTFRFSKCAFDSFAACWNLRKGEKE